MNHILSLIFSSLAWQRLAKALVFAVLALSISACSILDDDDDDDANKAPTSNAGEDQSVAEGTAVTLDGSGSSDSDGEIESYAWTLTTSNDAVTLSGEDTATASFTAPDVDADTDLVFRLTVTDNDGATATDEVTITVTDNSPGGGENAAPTANAGQDQKVDEGDEVTLAGSGSDSDGTIASYEWALTTTNDDVTLSGADTATASFTAPDVDADTALVFRLTVTDNDGATATDEVTITVTDNSTGGGENAAPTANAGQDQKVDEGDEVTLAGSGSDSDGTIASYAWALTTANDDVTLSGADTATASFTAPDVDADTALVFRLTVTDDDGATATDEVTITVTDNSTGGGENAAPTANAGQDQKVDEGDEVTLAGSGSDSDGTIASYDWALTTANDDVTLSGADTATASFTAPEVDEDTALVFRLTVTDNDGATATDDVTITIADTGSGGGDDNVRPTADAGDDQEVDEGDEVTLAGSGSDSDGTIASYEWTHTTSNDGVELSGADTATASFTAPEVDQETELAFRLTVTDNKGATGTSDTYVTVLDTDNGGGEEEQPSSQVLFASQYELYETPENDTYAYSHEGGDVTRFSGGAFWRSWGIDNPDWLLQRQAYGEQYGHDEAIDDSSYFGLALKAPNNGDLDISASDTLVIQMGNGASTDGNPNSHMVFTIELNGGEQDTTDYTWTNSCYYDQDLLEGSRPGPDQAAWVNTFGIHTYRVALANFTCTVGNMDDLKAELDEIAVKVVGGKDVEASATSSGNHSLIQVGYVGFSNDSAIVVGNGYSEYMLFASQYELYESPENDTYAYSHESGDVTRFSGGAFWRSWGIDNPDWLLQRQAYGEQYGHDEAIDDSSYFGLALKAPSNGDLDISASDTLVIQMGNGASTDGNPNSHMVFTIELNGGEQDTTDYTWTNSCYYDQELLEGSRPGPDQAAWVNSFGIHTYRVNLANFTCTIGNMEDLKAELDEIAVKVVGGKDVEASATSSGNHSLIQVGYVGFATDDYEENANDDGSAAM